MYETDIEKLKGKLCIILSSVPRVANAATWACARGCGAGLSQTLQITATCPIRALPDPDDGFHGVGRGGEDKDGDRRRKQPGRPGPAGRGCIRPQNYSPVRREGGWTRTVLRGKGEGERGAARDGHQENSDEGGGRQKPSGLASLATMRKPFARR